MAIGKGDVNYDSTRNTNYDFEQNQPKKRMGAKSFANMPEEPIIENYSRTKNYRSGIVNDFSCGLENESGIYDNHRGNSL